MLVERAGPHSRAPRSLQVQWGGQRRDERHGLLEEDDERHEEDNEAEEGAEGALTTVRAKRGANGQLPVEL